MRKLKEISEPTSCLNRALDDEPIFVLKSTDELAGSIVRTWAIMYFKQKSAQPMGMTPKQRAKYEEAMALALDMDRWHAEHKGEKLTPTHPLMTHDHLGQPAGAVDEPLSSQQVIERLCRLQALVFEKASGMDESDCFCGKGGFWGVADYGGTFEQGYRNDGRALKFIEEAVREKLERMNIASVEPPKEHA